MATKETQSEENVTKSGLGKALEIIASKISRKASVIALAMVLLYLLGASPTSPMLIFSSVSIGVLSMFVTILQYRIDKKKKNKKENG